MGHRRAKANQATKAKVAKAGKRSGAVRVTEPTEANAVRRAAGLKQFTLKRTPTVEVADLTGKLRAVPVPFLFDPKRGAVCVAPARKEAHK